MQACMTAIALLLVQLGAAQSATPPAQPTTVATTPQCGPGYTYCGFILKKNGYPQEDIVKAYCTGNVTNCSGGEPLTDPMQALYICMPPAAPPSSPPTVVPGTATTFVQVMARVHEYTRVAVPDPSATGTCPASAPTTGNSIELVCACGQSCKNQAPDWIARCQNSCRN